LTEVEYSKHALERMRVRRLSKKQVGITIRDPDFSYEDIESSALMPVKRYKERHSVVIYTIEEKRAKVITVYYASEVEAY